MGTTLLTKISFDTNTVLLSSLAIKE